MKAPLKWICDFVEVEDLSPDQIAEKLIFSGTEVEGIIRVGDFSDSYKVVEVIDVRKREGIKLPVCTIYDGKSKYEVLTGAPNIKKGKFLWCPPGSKVKKGNEYVEIGVKKVKDVSSYGMLLSPSEVGFPDAEEDKLLELPDYVEVGKTASEIFGLPDYILDISITPQRGDLLSIIGISIEISALTQRKLKLDVEKFGFPDFRFEFKEAEELSIEIKEKEKCKIYFGGIFSGELKSFVSDPSIICRLYLCGSRPINPIVDATNYVLFEYGQPTHAFDFDKISERKILVRNANAGEKILCLDGKERELSEDDLIIADGKRAVAIAGVIGGEETAVSLDTKNILLESAFFVPWTVRKTAKKLGIETESSYRFSRRVNPAGVFLAALRIKEILSQYGFEFVGAKVVGDFSEFSTKTVEFPLDFVSEYTGAHIDKKDILTSLQKLGIKIEEKGEKVVCYIPSWRGDISIKEDIVEEVVRITGYDKIPKTIPYFPAKYEEEDTKIRDFVEQIREKMVNLGYCEVKTYPFSKTEGIKIINPIASEFAFFSDKLEERIYEVIVESFKRGWKNVRIFEIEKDFEQRYVLAFGLLGFSFPQKWAFPKQKKSDIFDIKEVFENILPDIELKFDVKKQAEDFISFSVESDTVDIGEIIVRFSHEISELVYLGKIYLDKIFGLKGRSGRFYSEFPLIERDISFFVKEDIRWQDLKKLFFVSENVVDVFVFDVWEKDGRKSLTARVIIKQREKTMTSEEINEILKKIISNLSQVGLEVRAV